MAGLTVREGQRHRPAGTATLGAGRETEEGEKNLGSVGRGMCNPTRRPTVGTVPIRFGTYNIRNGRKGGLESALRGMSQANMDLGILQDTKITNGIYSRGVGSAHQSR